MLAKLVVAAAVVLGAIAQAEAAPRWIPTLQRQCTGRMTTSELDRCIAQHAPGSKLTEWAKDLRMIQTPHDGTYVFARIADRWRNVSQLEDHNYELLSARSLELAGEPATRIELGHVIDLRHLNGWLRERILLVCSDRAGCQRHLTACTVMQDGRAVEMFHTSVTVTEGGVSVRGDRSKTGIHCRHR